MVNKKPLGLDRGRGSRRGRSVMGVGREVVVGGVVVPGSGAVGAAVGAAAAACGRPAGDNPVHATISSSAAATAASPAGLIQAGGTAGAARTVAVSAAAPAAGGEATSMAFYSPFGGSHSFVPQQPEYVAYAQHHPPQQQRGGEDARSPTAVASAAAAAAAEAMGGGGGAGDPPPPPPPNHPNAFLQHQPQAEEGVSTGSARDTGEAGGVSHGQAQQATQTDMSCGVGAQALTATTGSDNGNRGSGTSATSIEPPGSSAQYRHPDQPPRQQQQQQQQLQHQQAQHQPAQHLPQQQHQQYHHQPPPPQTPPHHPSALAALSKAGSSRKLVAGEVGSMVCDAIERAVIPVTETLVQSVAYKVMRQLNQAVEEQVHSLQLQMDVMADQMRSLEEEVTSSRTTMAEIQRGLAEQAARDRARDRVERDATPGASGDASPCTPQRKAAPAATSPVPPGHNGADRSPIPALAATPNGAGASPTHDSAVDSATSGTGTAAAAAAISTPEVKSSRQQPQPQQQQQQQGKGASGSSKKPAPDSLNAINVRVRSMEGRVKALQSKISRADNVCGEDWVSGIQTMRKELLRIAEEQARQQQQLEEQQHHEEASHWAGAEADQTASGNLSAERVAELGTDAEADTEAEARDDHTDADSQAPQRNQKQQQRKRGAQTEGNRAARRAVEPCVGCHRALQATNELHAEVDCRVLAIEEAMGMLQSSYALMQAQNNNLQAMVDGTMRVQQDARHMLQGYTSTIASQVATVLKGYVDSQVASMHVAASLTPSPSMPVAQRPHLYSDDGMSASQSEPPADGVER